MELAGPLGHSPHQGLLNRFTRVKDKILNTGYLCWLQRHFQSFWNISLLWPLFWKKCKRRAKYYSMQRCWRGDQYPEPPRFQCPCINATDGTLHHQLFNIQSHVPNMKVAVTSYFHYPLLSCSILIETSIQFGMKVPLFCDIFVICVM